MNRADTRPADAPVGERAACREAHVSTDDPPAIGLWPPCSHRRLDDDDSSRRLMPMLVERPRLNGGVRRSSALGAAVEIDHRRRPRSLRPAAMAGFRLGPLPIVKRLHSTADLHRVAAKSIHLPPTAASNRPPTPARAAQRRRGVEHDDEASPAAIARRADVPSPPSRRPRCRRGR